MCLDGMISSRIIKFTTWEIAKRNCLLTSEIPLMEDWTPLLMHSFANIQTPKSMLKSFDSLIGTACLCFEDQSTAPANLRKCPIVASMKANKSQHDPHGLSNFLLVKRQLKPKTHKQNKLKAKRIRDKRRTCLLDLPATSSLAQHWQIQVMVMVNKRRRATAPMAAAIKARLWIV